MKEPGGRVVAATMIVVTVAGGIACRCFEAAKSFWLDELHTLDVAWRDGAGEVIAALLPDFHAPVYFLAVHATSPFIADPHDLRWLSITGGLLGGAAIWWILRDAGSTALARMTAISVYLLAPFQILYGSELRPYAWLGTLSLAAVAAAHGRGARPRLRFWMLVTAAGLALWVHYLAAVTIVAIGASRLVPRRGALRFRSILVAGTLSVAVFMPWVVYDESWLLTDPGVLFGAEVRDASGQVVEIAENAPPPRIRPRDLVAIAPRTLVPMGSALGERAGTTALIAAIALCVLAAAALVRTIIARCRGHSAICSASGRALFGPIAAGVCALVITAAACVEVWHRVPIQYFVVGAWVWPLLFAALIDLQPPGGLRGAMAGAVVAFAALGAAAHTAGAPREDVRRAVRVAVALADEHHALLTAVMRQPPHYRHTMAYRVYTDHACIEPAQVPPASASRRPVVVLARKSAPRPGERVWEGITQGRRVERVVPIDRSLRILLFVPST